MAPLPPKTVYDALIRAGASTEQAIAIMANAINESGLDPEAVNKSDPNGGSFGIVQQNGSMYSSLVSGVPLNDLETQVTVIGQNGGFQAASGATPSQGAGNFAANYEKCTGCQPGGSQWISRVGNVSTVAGWVTSGNWPKSAGSPSSGGTVVGGDTGPGTGCLLTNPFSTSLPLVGNISAGPSCLISKTAVRALVGGLLLGASGFVFLVGSLVLASYGLKGTAAGKAAGKAAGAAAGAIPVAGAPITATRKAAGRVRKAAGARKAGRKEEAELKAAGASDLRTARRPIRREIAEGRRPAPGRGVKTGSVPGPGRNATRRSDDRPPF